MKLEIRQNSSLLLKKITINNTLQNVRNPLKTKGFCGIIKLLISSFEVRNEGRNFRKSIR